MGMNPLCDDSFLGQMSSFYFDFKDPLNDQNKMDFYNKYQIQVPFMSWNNKSLFRISVQAYNNKQDIYRLIEALKDYQEKVRL
jgi:selenocysteine lyase/cysteine desulfurase